MHMQRKPDSISITQDSPLPGAGNGLEPFEVTIWNSVATFIPKELPAVFDGEVTWLGILGEDFDSGALHWAAGVYVVLRGKEAYAFVKPWASQDWTMEEIIAAYHGYSVGMVFITKR